MTNITYNDPEVAEEAVTLNADNVALMMRFLTAMSRYVKDLKNNDLKFEVDDAFGELLTKVQRLEDELNTLKSGD